MGTNSSHVLTDCGSDVNISNSAWSFLFLFGKNFHPSFAAEWMQHHWTRSFHLAVYYLFLVILGQQWMKGREKFDLRTPLVVWNLFLAVFSITGFLRLFPPFILLLYKEGFARTVCVRGLDMSETAYWVWLFALSKVLEFGDTFFIILRKQKLIFLHWYHHITVLIFTWHGCVEGIGPGKWFVTMNYGVHSVMYSYYALRALRLHFPRCVPMAVTCLQLAQMLVGAWVTFVAYSVKRRGEPCDQTDKNLAFAFVLYTSYFGLFAYFFVKAYFYTEGKFTYGRRKVD